MTTANSDIEKERILIFTPTGRDATLTQKIFTEANISSHICADIEELCREIDAGVGAVLMTEEALSNRAIECLTETLEKQLAWSDVPFLLFATDSQSATILLNTLGERANITILERPINIGVVKGATRSALRARRRQYQTQTLLAELEAADRQKDLFLATISHELRTPLNAILGWTSILRSGKTNEQTTLHALETIERNARAQAQLIDDILDVSRITRGKLRLNPVRFNLSTIIKAAVDILHPAAVAKKINLATILEAEELYITGDPNRLQQVVWNLLSNAIKFTPPGGSVNIALERQNSQVRIIVSDTGKGINADFLPHVFDYFRQADNTITRNYGGLGLGLAIVRHLVELHGGTVSAASQGEGKGSTFTVELPIKAVAISSQAPPTIGLQESELQADNKTFRPYDALKGLHILIVDDTDDARELLAEMLGRCGAKITTASSASEALAKLKDSQFDILISDIEMPNQDGYSLIQRVRELGSRQGTRIPAVALTAHARPADRIHALSAGYDIHIAKPVEVAELMTVVARMVKKKAPPEPQNQYKPKERSC